MHMVVIDVIRDCCIFFFNDTATTEIYTLSLHDALPISSFSVSTSSWSPLYARTCLDQVRISLARSEEHTSELQSRQYLVCRLLLEREQELDGDLHLLGIEARHRQQPLSTRTNVH